MGDWAEGILASAIAKALPGKKVVHYGDSNSVAAGEPGFKQNYTTGLIQVCKYGKRPDLLIMPQHVKCETRTSTSDPDELMELGKCADFSIEVRSSKFEALKYMEVRAQQRTEGNKAGREAPSFTVKVEDLKLVYRWLELHDCPQLYCQVFFDSVFAINFLTIFQIIASGKGFAIENPKKNQEKATIMIPITSGCKIATCSLPEFRVEHRVTKLGRHDAFVKPVGGEAILNAEKLLQTAASAAAFSTS